MNVHVDSRGYREVQSQFRSTDGEVLGPLCATICCIVRCVVFFAPLKQGIHMNFRVRLGEFERAVI